MKLEFGRVWCHILENSVKKDPECLRRLRPGVRVSAVLTVVLSLFVHCTVVAQYFTGTLVHYRGNSTYYILYLYILTADGRFCTRVHVQFNSHNSSTVV